MKTAILTRKPSTPEGTFGTWVSGTGFKCVTLERPADGDHPCIPTGTYLCAIRYSPSHKCNIYGVQAVPGRSDIEIHAANWCFQLLGCIAPGAIITQIQTPDNRMQIGVTASKYMLDKLMTDMAGEDFKLTIKEDL